MTKKHGPLVLSAHEEVTLRRAALGIATAEDLDPLAVYRLRRLGLIEQTTLALTPLGKGQYETLPRLTGLPGAEQKFVEDVGSIFKAAPREGGK